MGQLNTRLCRYCNSEFTPNSRGQLFCSNSCVNKFQSRKIRLICDYCNDVFYVSPSLAAGRMFCSRKCADLARTKEYKIKCAGCGMELVSKRKDQKYCSAACANRHNKNNPERIRKLIISHYAHYDIPIEKEILINLYISNNFTIKQCADFLKVSSGTIRLRLHRLGVKVRTKSETKIGVLNPRFGKPGIMLGKHHSEEARQKLSISNLANPRRYWLGKKRPEMADVQGFGDHKGKTFEEIMRSKDRATLRRAEMSKRFIDNPDIPRRQAIKMLQNLGNYKSNTKIERDMKSALISHGFKEGADFIHQYNFLDKNIFSCDFGFPQKKLVVECDGDFWHANPLFYKLSELYPIQKRNLSFDKSKNAYIKACGWKILRFWENEIKNDVDKCVKEVILNL